MAGKAISKVGKRAIRATMRKAASAMTKQFAKKMATKALAGAATAGGAYAMNKALRKQ